MGERWGGNEKERKGKEEGRKRRRERKKITFLYLKYKCVK